MKHASILTLSAACLALTACGDKASEEANNAGAANNSAAALELPPMVKASHTYRCADSSLIFVDFMSDDKTANIRTEKAGMPTVLTAAEPGQPFTAEGFSLDGTGDQVKATLPGKAEQSCKA